MVRASIPDDGGLSTKTETESQITSESRIPWDIARAFFVESSPLGNEQLWEMLQNEEDVEKALRILNVCAVANDIHKRSTYGGYVLIATAIWMMAVLITVWMSATSMAVQKGVCFPNFSLTAFKLSDGVLVALITTTTANVIAVLLVVVNYLFPAGASVKGSISTGPKL